MSDGEKTMKTICPNCKSEFIVPDRYIGKKVKCRKCNILVEIIAHENSHETNTVPDNSDQPHFSAVIIAIIVGGLALITIGFACGYLINRPTREKTDVEIAEIKSKAQTEIARIKSESQKQRDAEISQTKKEAQAEIARIKSETEAEIANIQSKNDIALSKIKVETDEKIKKISQEIEANLSLELQNTAKHNRAVKNTTTFPEILTIIHSGGGVIVDASKTPSEVLLAFASSAGLAEGKCTVIVKNAGCKTTTELCAIASQGKGSVLFDLTGEN